MDSKYWTGLAVLTVAWLIMGMPAPVSAQPADETGWEEQAERSFSLPQGTASQLMTQEEWQQHRQKMLGLDREKRNKYRKEWHDEMIERAKERGLSMPAPPEPELKIPGVDEPGTEGGGGMGQGGGY